MRRLPAAREAGQLHQMCSCPRGQGAHGRQEVVGHGHPLDHHHLRHVLPYLPHGPAPQPAQRQVPKRDLRFGSLYGTTHLLDQLYHRPTPYFLGIGLLLAEASKQTDPRLVLTPTAVTTQGCERSDMHGVSSPQSSAKTAAAQKVPRLPYGREWGRFKTADVSASARLTHKGSMERSRPDVAVQPAHKRIAATHTRTVVLSSNRNGPRPTV